MQIAHYTLHIPDYKLKIAHFTVNISHFKNISNANDIITYYKLRIMYYATGASICCTFNLTFRSENISDIIFGSIPEMFSDGSTFTYNLRSGISCVQNP